MDKKYENMEVENHEKIKDSVGIMSDELLGTVSGGAGKKNSGADLIITDRPDECDVLCD